MSLANVNTLRLFSSHVDTMHSGDSFISATCAALRQKVAIRVKAADVAPVHPGTVDSSTGNTVGARRMLVALLAVATTRMSTH